MKKKLVILVFTTILIMLCALTSIAATSATVNTDSTSGYRGETIKVTASLAKSVTVGSGAVSLTYDKNVMELVKGEWEIDDTTLSTFEVSSGKGAFAYMSAEKISGDLFTATFKIKNNAAFGDYTVKMTVQLKDGSNEDINVTNKNGEVTVKCKHKYDDWTSTGDTSHSRTCSICKEKDTENHDYDNACDTTCNTCGHTRNTTHSYSTKYSFDSTSHWYECSVCKDKKDVSAHTPGPEATEDNPQVCTTCGYVIKEALAHVHKPEDAWSSDEDSHWHNCTTCDGKTDIADHVYDNDCDEDCNICGHKRTVTHKYSEIWLFNKTEHWHVCLLCGATDTPVAHTQGADTCPDCGFEFVDTGENTPPPATESPATNPPATSEPKQEETGFSFISMLIGIAIGAAISAVTAIIIVKKKR